MAVVYPGGWAPGPWPPLNFQHFDLKKIKYDYDMQRILRNYCLLRNYIILVLYAPSLPSTCQ